MFALIMNATITLKTCAISAAHCKYLKLNNAMCGNMCC